MNSGAVPVAITQKTVAIAVLAAFLAGIALQFSMPPLSQGWLVFAAFVPLLFCLDSLRSPFIWTFSGLCVGLGWAAVAPMAMLGWGSLLMAVPWLLSAAITATIFLFAYVVHHALPLQYRWLALPACWTTAWCVSGLVDVPILSPTAALSLWQPKLLGIARLIGVTGADFLVLSINALVVQVMGAKKRSSGSIALLVLLLAIFLLGSMMPAPASIGYADINAIQPALEPGKQHAQKWSIPQRLANESHIDSLLEQAVQDDVLVILPEGGNELFNKRLPQRRQYLESLMKDRSAELLLSGKDLTPEGYLRNIVSRITRDGFREDIVKTHTAPFAEANMQRGIPDVVHTAHGVAGVSICYDSVFSSQWRQHMKKGAQFAIVVTDDSSFGVSTLAQWHLAYSMMHAIETGRALAYLSNFGPSVVTDIDGTVLPDADWFGKQADVYRWRIKKASQQTLATRGGRYVLVILSVAVGFYALFAAATGEKVFRHTATYITNRPRMSITLLMAATGSVLIYCCSVAFASRMSASEMVRQLVYQVNHGGVVDGLAPAFLQSKARNCGAAAISYLLTQLGDVVFEHDVERTIPMASAEGYSLQELAQFATSRGFTAKGMSGGTELLDERFTTPFVAHMSHSHYVVVLNCKKDRVAFFDPAAGKTLNMPRSDFVRQWTGKILLLGTQRTCTSKSSLRHHSETTGSLQNRTTCLAHIKKGEHKVRPYD